MKTLSTLWKSIPKRIRFCFCDYPDVYLLTQNHRESKCHRTCLRVLNPWTWQKLCIVSGVLTSRCLLILHTGWPLRPGRPDVSQRARGLVFCIQAQHGRRQRTDPRIFLLTRIPVQFQQLWSGYVEPWQYLRNVSQEKITRNKWFVWELPIVPSKNKKLVVWVVFTYSEIFLYLNII